MRRCRRVLDHLEEYLSEGLDSRAQRAVQAHLAQCPRCAAEFRASRELLKRLPSDVGVSVPEEARGRILAGVLARRPISAAPAVLPRLARGLAYTAVAGAAAAAVLYVALPQLATPPPGAGHRPPGPPVASAPTPPVEVAQATPSPPAPPPPVPPETVTDVPVQNVVPVTHPEGNRRLCVPRNLSRTARRDTMTVPETPAVEEESLVAPEITGEDDATVVTPEASEAAAPLVSAEPAPAAPTPVAPQEQP